MMMAGTNKKEDLLTCICLNTHLLQDEEEEEVQQDLIHILSKEVLVTNPFHMRRVILLKRKQCI